MTASVESKDKCVAPNLFKRLSSVVLGPSRSEEMFVPYKTTHTKRTALPTSAVIYKLSYQARSGPHLSAVHSLHVIASCRLRQEFVYQLTPQLELVLQGS